MVRYTPDCPECLSQGHPACVGHPEEGEATTQYGTAPNVQPPPYGGPPPQYGAPPSPPQYGGPPPQYGGPPPQYGGPPPQYGAPPPPYGGPPPQYGAPPPPPQYGGPQPAYGYPGVDPAAPYGRHPQTGEPLSDKSKLAAGLLQIFLGAFGVGRFYLGDTGIALAQLFTCGGLGVWSLIDGIMILTGDVRDKNGRPLRS
jgi:hypothetical protein